jgi:hypothetical protein
LLYGGQTVQNHASIQTLADVHMFDLETQAWKAHSDCLTTGRTWHTATFLPGVDLLVVYGGERFHEKTKKMKRDAFEKASNKRTGIKRARAVKPSCIYCKRQVGTIFSTTNATYRAICGDKSKPCALNINIFNGDNFNMLQLLSIYQEDVVDAKNDIIRQKLDTIFHYTKDEKSVKMFKDTLEKYNKTSKMYTDLMIRYQELYENPEASEQLKRKHQEMYRVQEQISILKREYEKTGEKEVLTTMVETYKDELIPIIQNIRLLKYDTMAVETSEDQHHWTSTLVQHHVALYKRDFIYGESPRVVKFDMV